ncbi:MAG: S46 family peptidase [Salinibacter sp.]
MTVAERPDAPADTVAAAAPMDTTASVVPIPSGYDTVEVGRFDRGKLWPFTQLPTEYFRSTYGVDADEAWRTKARRAALRFGEGCSASFVSSRGLVMTNHHCARDAISSVSRSGENLLENGYYADSLVQERVVPDLHVDELVGVEDVTGRVRGGGEQDLSGGSTQQRIQSIETTMTQSAKKKDEQLRVDVVSLYNGVKYAAYTYRRYEDVRLVMAPELRVGYFGGESDNFTYPRFSLDVAFFRVYDSDGSPLHPEHYFSWDLGGAEAGESVFAIGNPGSTSRLKMVSQLTYERDHRLPARLEVFRDRRARLQSYIANHPEKATAYDLRNTFFSIKNTIKSLEGRLRGLQNSYLMARRGAAVQALRDSIAAIDSLQQYGRAIGEIRRLQQSKRILADKEKAFLTFANLELGSRILTRALHGYYYDFLRTRGANPERVQDIRDDAETIGNWPPDLERSMIVAQLKDLRSAFGPNHPTMQRLLRKRSVEALATHLVENSALMDSTKFVKLLDKGYLKSDDPSVPVIEALAPLFLNMNRQMQDIQSTEETLNRRLSRARRAIYGDQVPPDATFTLRLSDGVVRGYSYNGTQAPAHTTFYGLYDRHYSHRQEDWALPERWLSPPEAFDPDTPLNLVTTNDISGGSSGSPLLNEDLELVGVVFDSNMDALPNEYLYRDHSARAISVDVRGIVEALRDVYEADRLVEEITNHSASGPSTAGEAE